MDSMVEENGANSSIEPLSVGNGTDNSASSSHVEGASDARQPNNNNNNNNNTSSSEFPANILTAQSPAALTVLKTSAPNVVHLISHPSSQGTVIQSSVIQSANHIQPIITTKSGAVMSAAGAPPPSGHTVYLTSKSTGSVIQAPGIRIKQEPYANTPMSAMESTDEEDSCSEEDTASRKRRDMLTRRPSYHKILKEISGPDMTVLSGPVVPEDQSRKREIRLQKNREAARECRRKKKEYIKCLENRVAVLENQNKALIEELKSLKELYCMTKTE